MTRGRLLLTCAECSHQWWHPPLLCIETQEVDCPDCATIHRVSLEVTPTPET